jgi:hypothetical protein
MGTGVLFSGVKRAEPEVHYPNTSKADVKNEWSYIPAVALRLSGVDRDTFTFTLARCV